MKVPGWKIILLPRNHPIVKYKVRRAHDRTLLVFGVVGVWCVHIIAPHMEHHVVMVVGIMAALDPT